jgi:PilZ domain
MDRSELENRLKKRYPSSLYVSVFLGSNGEFFGLLADLSGTGFKLTTGAEITINTEYALAIKNPFSGRSDELNHFAVQSVWCQQNQDGLYDAGFQFIHFEPETEKLFKRLSIDFESTARSMNKLEK